MGGAYPVRSSLLECTSELACEGAAAVEGTLAQHKQQQGSRRIRVDGKLFRSGDEPWYLKGLTYGPFSRSADGFFLPARGQWRRDFAQMRALGANAIRLYHPPLVQLLDDALEAGIAVLIDVPWEKHRCFLEDWEAQADAIGRVREAARELGRHPAVMGISVANEVPADVVRFHGARRVEQFIGNLLDAHKQEAPDCLCTYCNFPTTEFLSPAGIDFYCANVYLEDPRALGAYLDRLHHVAGDLPVVLGEFGIDSIRHGEGRQADLLGGHVREVFRRGLAGSFVFSFTDEWFTGGYRIHDWAFGVTTAEREEKPAAAELARAWSGAPHLAAVDDQGGTPKVSVVVCSFNGAATLEDCLRSLLRLEYPRYEVILVDDGSTDGTTKIAAKFPAVRYLRQENLGLSVARNAGALAASGEVVAYTDADCVADPLWLTYLVTAMRERGVDAIGGPNVPPPSDGWVARCVAASPGGPSHVMLDDVLAEHVPGCNMALRRDTLLALGGFDARFRQAGDDVDVCWRFLDAGWTIGYAPAALVWHHRRSTVGQYLRQQRGYGRSEAMIQFKHPHRFNALGASRWAGVIYAGGSDAGGDSKRVYHGRFGFSPFQIMYRQNGFGWASYLTLLEWHALAAAVAVVALVSGRLPMMLLALGMEAAAVAAAAVSGARAARAAFPKGAPTWCRPLVCALHLLQPVVRSLHRYRYRCTHRTLPAMASSAAPAGAMKCVKRIAPRAWDVYFSSERGVGRLRLLEELESAAKQAEWAGDYHAEWEPHDVELTGGLWHNIRLRTVTEELGADRRFTRVRASLHWSEAAKLAAAGCAVLVAAAAARGQFWPVAAAAALPALLGIRMLAGARRCRRAVAELVFAAGAAAGLEPVPVRDQSPLRSPARRSEPRSRGALPDELPGEVCVE